MFATLLLYFTLCRVLSPGSSPHTASAVGAVTFIFLAPNLWYYSNVYSWDTFWHYLWVAGILCVIRISNAIRHSRLTAGSLVLLGLVIFFITYSEYQGLIFGGCVAAWGLRKRRESSDYSIVKTLVFLAALIAWLFQKAGATPGIPRMGKVAVWMGLVGALGGSLYVYQFGFARTAETSRYQDLGHEIAAALDSEVVFAVSAESIVPQVIYYAQRNIQTVAGKEDALLWLKLHGRDKGRLFYVDSAYKLMRAEPLRTP